MKAKTKRIIAVILVVTLVLTIVFAEAFIVAEAEHDCVGEGCPICEKIAVFQAVIGAYAVALLLITAVKMQLFISGFKHLLYLRIICNNPIKLRVKLLN